jgi:transposase-like protein
MLAERGILVFGETVRRWVNHFDPRSRRPPQTSAIHAIWHLGEVYLKIDGRMVCLWRAVDAEGEVLDASGPAGTSSIHAYPVVTHTHYM